MVPHNCAVFADVGVARESDFMVPHICAVFADVGVAKSRAFTRRSTSQRPRLSVTEPWVVPPYTETLCTMFRAGF